MLRKNEIFSEHEDRMTTAEARVEELEDMLRSYLTQFQ
jgi:hypothetical protein